MNTCALLVGFSIDVTIMEKNIEVAQKIKKIKLSFDLNLLDIYPKENKN